MQRLVQRADGDYVLTSPVLSADGEPLSGTPTAPASVVVVDGAGTEVWSDGTYFGKATPNGGSWWYGSENQLMVSKFTASAGNITKLSVYLANTLNTVAKKVRPVIYADSSGAPGALIQLGPEATVGGSRNTWVDLPFSTPVAISAAAYWIGCIAESGTEDFKVAVNPDSGNSVKRKALTYPNVTDPFGTPSETYSDYSLDVRAYYEAGISYTVRELGADVVTASVPASAMPGLDTYLARWSVTVDDASVTWASRHEVCGARLCSLAELRQAYAELTGVPDDELEAARLRAEERLERAAGVAFCPRGGRATVTGDGTLRLLLPVGAGLRRVVSAQVDGVAITEDELAQVAVREWGALDRIDGSGWPDGSQIAVHYEHGLDLPVPGPVSVATMVLAREYVVRSALSSRAMGESTELGFLRLSVADGDASPTGIPEVDAVIAAYGRRRPVVA